MTTKPLYIFVSNCGDGSYHAKYTFNEEVKDFLTDSKNEDIAIDNGLMDGDGTHYDILNVPIDTTYESLGISFPLEWEDIEEWIENSKAVW